jgi:acetyl esterase
MTVDPEAQIVIDAVAKAEAAGRPRFEQMTPAEARALYRDTRRALTPEPPDVAHVEDLTAPGPDGDIPVRYYRPKGSDADTALPVLVYFHGGGWVIGDLDTHDVVCRQLANDGGFAVISVDYRMGPEHKFPAAVEDSFAVTQWAAQGAGGLKIDGSRLAVAGDSAGGNLAAVISLMARDQGVPIAFQALLYPATKAERDSESQRLFAEGYLLTDGSQRWFQDHYFNGREDFTDWRTSPLLAADHTGLAPAYVMTAGYDPLRDEGKAYAECLEAAGVPTVYRCFEGQIHGFLTMGKVITQSYEALAEAAGHIAGAFSPAP